MGDFFYFFGRLKLHSFWNGVINLWLSFQFIHIILLGNLLWFYYYIDHTNSSILISITSLLSCRYFTNVNAQLYTFTL